MNVKNYFESIALFRKNDASDNPIFLAKSHVEILERVLLGKLKFCRLRIVYLAKVLLISGVVRTCYTDVVTSKASIRTTFIKVVARTNIKDEAIASYVNLCIGSFSVVLSDFF